jgi:hypothetical protein
VPADIVNKLNAQIVRVQASPEFLVFAKTYGYEAMGGNPAALASVQEKESPSGAKSQGCSRRARPGDPARCQHIQVNSRPFRKP